MISERTKYIEIKTVFLKLKDEETYEFIFKLEKIFKFYFNITIFFKIIDGCLTKKKSIILNIIYAYNTNILFQ